jgi:hypothetical protein
VWLVRVGSGGGRPLVSVVEDVLGLRLAKAKPAALRAHVLLR